MSVPPVNANSTQEVRDLLGFLYEISGKRVMSGQHNFPGKLSFFSEEVAELGGAYPAVWGQDFGFSDDDQDGVQFRDRVVEEAIKQHEAGSIITLMWHAVPPNRDEPVTFKNEILGHLEDADWESTITPGKALNLRWQEQSDVIAGLLKRLSDAKVPVLWRPYHEMNGDWFWWCNRPGPRGYSALYRMLYDRFVNVHGLNNLLWVWNANAPRANAKHYEAFFPGLDVVDVLATDVYANDYREDHYLEILDLAQGRPVALGEVGNMPTPELLAQEPQWCWFMTWSGFVASHNDPKDVRRLYQDPRTLNRPARF